MSSFTVTLPPASDCLLSGPHHLPAELAEDPQHVHLLRPHRRGPLPSLVRAGSLAVCGKGEEVALGMGTLDFMKSRQSSRQILAQKICRVNSQLLGQLFGQVNCQVNHLIKKISSQLSSQLFGKKDFNFFLHYCDFLVYFG